VINISSFVQKIRKWTDGCGRTTRKHNISGNYRFNR